MSCEESVTNSRHKNQYTQFNQESSEVNWRLSGVPSSLSGVQKHFQLYHSLCTRHGNMSMTRRPRKLKPPHPDEQPQIIQYITDSIKDSPTVEKRKSKKRCRSTGEKPNAKKRIDSLSNSPPPSLKTLRSVPNESDQEHIINKMSTIQMDDTSASTNSPML